MERSRAIVTPRAFGNPRSQRKAGLQFVHKLQNIAFALPETRDVMNFLYRRDVE